MRNMFVLNICVFEINEYTIVMLRVLLFVSALVAFKFVCPPDIFFFLASFEYGLVYLPSMVVMKEIISI